MFKKKYLLVLLGFMTIMLPSCKKNKSNSILDSKPKISETSTSRPSAGKPNSVSAYVNKITKFNNALTSSKPTKVKTSWTYDYASLGITLRATSTLTIEYGDELKACYNLKKEVLNPAGSSEFKSEKEYTGFCKGTDYGALKNGSVKWNEPSETIILTPYTLSEDWFEADLSVSDTLLKGTFKDENLSDILADTHGISKMSYTLSISDDKVSSILSSYMTSEKVKVNMNSYFTYNPVTVSIPE